MKEPEIPEPFLLIDANGRLFIKLGSNLMNHSEYIKKPLIRR